MRHEVVLHDGVVGHGSVDQAGEGIPRVLANDNVSPPGHFLSERGALEIANAFIDWERHTVPRNGGIEHHVWTGEFFVHAVKRFDELGYRRESRNTWISRTEIWRTWHFHARGPYFSAI